jgi:Domain of unknown function (DUF4845)
MTESDMNSQKGVSMVSLIVVLVVLIICAGLGIKVGPPYMEYLQIKKAVTAIVESGEVRSGSVADVRKAFDRRALVDGISAINSQDLDISKDGGDLVITFAYPQKVPLAGNVSLLFDFAGGTKK